MAEGSSSPEKLSRLSREPGPSLFLSPARNGQGSHQYEPGGVGAKVYVLMYFLAETIRLSVAWSIPVNGLFPKTADYVFRFASLLSTGIVSTVICIGMALTAWKEMILCFLCPAFMGAVMARPTRVLVEVSPNMSAGATLSDGFTQNGDTEERRQNF